MGGFSGKRRSEATMSMLTSLTTNVEAEKTTLSALIMERGDVAVGWWNMARFNGNLLVPESRRDREGEEGGEEGGELKFTISAFLLGDGEGGSSAFLKGRDALSMETLRFLPHELNALLKDAPISLALRRVANEASRVCVCVCVCDGFR